MPKCLYVTDEVNWYIEEVALVFSFFFFSFVHMYHQCINLKFKIVLYFHCPSLKQEWKTECL